MRFALAAEYINQREAADIVEVVAALLANAHNIPDYLVAMEHLLTALGDNERIPYTKRAEVYARAKQAGHEEIARLLFDASPVQPAAAKLDAMAPERPVTPRGRSLTLGERKSLARSHRRDLLLHLLRDPHPDVVAILLGNPHLTENDVIKIASSRPAAPESLQIVAESQRWNARYAVRCALAKNPYTPLHLALRLATTLRSEDLRAIASDMQLSPGLRQQAEALLGRRS